MTPESLVVAVLGGWQQVLHASSPVDHSCNVNEVSRLLWSVLAVATAVGVAVVRRPTWLRVTALAAAGLYWMWIDMEGPVLVSRGTHGLHVADLPVVVAIAASGAGAVRLLLDRRRRRVLPAAG